MEFGFDLYGGKALVNNSLILEFFRLLAPQWLQPGALSRQRVMGHVT